MEIIESERIESGGKGQIVDSEGLVRKEEDAVERGGSRGLYIQETSRGNACREALIVAQGRVRQADEYRLPTLKEAYGV